MTSVAQLQMGPGGMMPTGWDWGSMWLLMLFPALAVIGAIVLVVFLVTRQGRQLSPVQIATSPLLQPPTNSPPAGTQQRVEDPKPASDVLGRVVLSMAPTLTNDERRVMDELARAGGELLQSDLPEKTGYSKGTVSKAIHSLEVRGIVVREPHRWTYWCRVNPRLVERFGQPEAAAAEPPS